MVLVAIQLSVLGLYLPPVFKKARCHHYRPRRSFHSRSTLRCEAPRAVGALLVLVAVQLSVPGLYLPPVFETVEVISSTPDDHFTAGPDCRVTVSATGRVGQVGGCPTIRAGIVSPTGVRVGPDSDPSAPNDHFTASPDRGVTGSGNRDVSGGRSRPRIIRTRRTIRASAILGRV